MNLKLVGVCSVLSLLMFTDVDAMRGGAPNASVGEATAIKTEPVERVTRAKTSENELKMQLDEARTLIDRISALSADEKNAEFKRLLAQRDRADALKFLEAYSLVHEADKMLIEQENKNRPGFFKRHWKAITMALVAAGYGAKKYGDYVKTQYAENPDDMNKVQKVAAAYSTGVDMVTNSHVAQVAKEKGGQAVNFVKTNAPKVGQAVKGKVAGVAGAVANKIKGDEYETVGAAIKGRGGAIARGVGSRVAGARNWIAGKFKRTPKIEDQNMAEMHPEVVDNIVEVVEGEE